MAASTVKSDEVWKEAYARTLAGTHLAARASWRLPANTLGEKMVRARVMMEGMRVMKMGDWRPVFPYYDSRL